jgi:hypothetical protein
MGSLETLAGAVTLVALAASMLGLLILIAPNGVALDDLFRPPADLPWPRGVQEEEPLPWRHDRLEGYRSSGRRPTTHQATGNSTAARTIFRASPSRKGVSPSAIVSSGLDEVTTPSHGRPIA